MNFHFVKRVLGTLMNVGHTCVTESMSAHAFNELAPTNVSSLSIKTFSQYRPVRLLSIKDKALSCTTFASTNKN